MSVWHKLYQGLSVFIPLFKVFRLFLLTFLAYFVGLTKQKNTSSCFLFYSEGIPNKSIVSFDDKNINIKVFRKQII